MPVLFESVELSEEETAAVIKLAIKQATEKKHSLLEAERRKKLADQRLNDHRRPFTPAEMYNLAKWRATQVIRFRTGNPTVEFEPTDFQKPVTTALSLYFSNSPEFEKLDRKLYNTTKLDFSLNKGIWLWGNPGVGKTLMMEMFNRNKRMCYDLVECPKICYLYIKDGDIVFDKLINECVVNAPDSSTFFQKTKGFCYNDLGTENVSSSHYGNPINVMEYILLQSYERKLPYWQRHVTTNLTFDQVKETYGVRVLDRIKECFNIIEVNGYSLRK